MGETESEGHLRFGVFELTTDSLELRRSGRRVRLAPQPARALLYLAHRQGQVVSRDELAAHLWDDDVFVDVEAGVHAVIKQIRRALGDSSQGARFVETLPRRGYRFLAQVEIVAPHGAGLDAGSRVAGSRVVGLWRWAAAVAAVAAVAVLVAVSLWPARGAGDAAVSATADSVTDDAPVVLDVEPVLAPGAADAYFKARYVFEQGGAGSGARAAELFERALELDPRSVPATLGLAQSRLRQAAAGTFGRREALEIARRAADAALAPMVATWTSTPTAQQVAVPATLQAEALELRARVRWRLDLDWAGAESDLRRAVALRPAEASAYQALAFLLSAQGRHWEALDAIATARTFDPLSPAANLDVAWLFYFARRYEMAVAEGLRALELSPGFLPAQHCLVEAYDRLGRPAAALEHARAMTVAAGAAPARLVSASGRDPGADPASTRRAILDWWLDAERGGPPLPAYVRAQIELDGGRRAEALRYLEESLESLDPSVVMVGVDPRFDALRDDPAFDRLLARLGLTTSRG